MLGFEPSFLALVFLLLLLGASKPSSSLDSWPSPSSPAPPWPLVPMRRVFIALSVAVFLVRSVFCNFALNKVSTQDKEMQWHPMAKVGKRAAPSNGIGTTEEFVVVDQSSRQELSRAVLTLDFFLVDDFSVFVLNHWIGSEHDTASTTRG